MTFVVYLLGILLLGIRAYRQTHDLGDYLLGGRKLGAAVTALSVGASDMSVASPWPARRCLFIWFAGKLDWYRPGRWRLPKLDPRCSQAPGV